MALFEIKDLNFSYPDAGVPAIQKINFSIEQGEFMVICGKSGCGKTTLLRHFKTVMTPYGKREGEILFEGQPLEEISVRKQSAEIGYVLQSPDNQIVTDKVWHELAFGVENLGYDQQTIRLRVAEMASFFGIQNWFSKNVEELSGGQKQLLNLASVMAMQPKVLVLDEPTSQLDPIAASEFLSTIRKINLDLGITVIIIEHRLEEVFPMADKVLVLEDGKQTFFDTPRMVGKELADHDLFLAMPSPVQIYNKTGQEGVCPLTVCEGRNWLEEHYKGQEEIKEEVKYPEKKRKNLSKKEAVISVKEVWFRYEKEGKDIVRDLSLQVKKGELFCILGGNGTGKSTTLSLLSGIHRPYRGKIFLQGRDIRKIPEKELFHHFLGVLPQNPQSLFVGNTVEEDLWEMINDLSPLKRKEHKEKIEQVVEDTEIGHLLHMHPYDLSGGEQQRAALAKVLLLEPEILLLDEPTKGLDGFYKSKLAGIFKRLQEKGITILMVSHDIEFCASYADTCAMFFDGAVVTACDSREFFTGNSFYTTAANRMARHIFPDAVTVKDVIESCRRNRRQE
ncbi:MAG: energy-coupling factor transporter ATPase [Blautia sp.]|nr:energy-coupling factor transporter ATPase [Blautia sp.]